MRMETAFPRHFAIFASHQAAGGISHLLLPEIITYLDHQSILHTLFDGAFPRTLLSFTDILVVGGDYSINQVLNHFQAIDLPISVIATDTGNDFINGLQGKRNFEEQLNIAVGGNKIIVDAGKCNETLFINRLGFGFSGKVAAGLPGQNIFSGHLAYYTKVLPLLFSYKERYITLETENGELSGYFFLISVGNGRTYGDGFPLTPEADCTDGYLDVLMVREIGILKRWRHLAKVVRARHTRLPFVEYFKTRSMRISSPAPLDAQIDGEYFRDTRFEISILPKQFIFRY